MAVGPVYWTAAGMTATSVACTHGGQPCANVAYTLPNSGTGSTTVSSVYFPVGSTYQADGDRHNAIADTVYTQGEADGYLCNNQLSCTNSGFFPYTAGGFSGPSGGNSGGNAPGYAAGVAEITAADLKNFSENGVRIGHALGIVEACLSNSSTYPSSTRGSDVICGSGNSYASPAPIYGSLIHLKASVSVPSLTSDPNCQAVLYAFQDYGAYTADNNNTGLGFEFEAPRVYNLGPWTSNPWTAGMQASMNTSNGCLAYITSASQLEVLNLNGALPTYYGYGDPRN
jgi:hypothetical protein